MALGWSTGEGEAEERRRGGEAERRRWMAEIRSRRPSATADNGPSKEQDQQQDQKKQRMGLRVIYITQSALLNVNLTTLCALQ